MMKTDDALSPAPRPRRCRCRALVLAGALCGLTRAPIPASAAPTRSPPAQAGGLSVDLPVQAFTLMNGLRVYVLEDHSSPAFSLAVFHDVGSRDEVLGRTGLAHLP